MLISVSHGILIFAPVAMMLNGREENTLPFSNVLSLSLAAYGFFGMVQIFHPIGGLMADVCCGRYKIIMLSLLSNWLGHLVASILAAFLLRNVSTSSYSSHVLGAVCFTLVFMTWLIGYSGFHANVVQFGLDQMLGAPSEKLSLFLHWFVWSEYVGIVIPKWLSTASPCSETTKKLDGIVPMLWLAICTVHLLLGYYGRHWFHCEKTVSNPYRKVYEVLKFVLRRDKQLGPRSATTYSDDIVTPKMDIAKLKYGGPFSTEVVEDVKTLLRMLLMLFVITAVFSLDVATSHLFPIFGLHLGKHMENGTSPNNCTYEWVLFQSGSLSSIVPVMVIPLYIIFIYPHTRNWIPRIFVRLGTGILLMASSVTFMFTIQVAANYNAQNYMSNSSICLFIAEYRTNDNSSFPLSPTLGFRTEVLVIPALLNGLAAPLINITILEFISAQSPHTMKGLLLGFFYAFKGLFILLGSAFTIPFAQESLWGGKHGIYDCSFYYYLMNSVLAILVLIVFVFAAKWYKYRERDDPPYRRQYVEEYYSRYAGVSSDKLLNHVSFLSYGTN